MIVPILLLALIPNGQSNSRKALVDHVVHVFEYMNSHSDPDESGPRAIAMVKLPQPILRAAFAEIQRHHDRRDLTNATLLLRLRYVVPDVEPALGMPGKKSDNPGWPWIMVDKKHCALQPYQQVAFTGVIGRFNLVHSLDRHEQDFKRREFAGGPIYVSTTQ